MTSNSDRHDEPRTKPIVFGVSIAGPAHVSAGQPNQDAWGWARWRLKREDVYCAVICDGLGSRPYAREGAQAGVRAAKRAARHWVDAPGASPSLLIRLVEVLWRLEVAPLPPGDCATTCLLALVFVGGRTTRLVTVALGDSRCLVEVAGRIQILGDRPPDQFSNVTEGLGTPHHMDAWQVQETETPGQLRILLLSDGIADDIPLENAPEFLEWLVDFEDRPTAARARALRRALKQWPVPGHTDDKTLFYLHLRGS